ncbi:UNVERIFIED_CONTAM: RNA polymerase II subunit A C-terminal domain phosphatase SSU72 [Sesamum radiatum]|uniref:RNA polymerase II subunit A C-terminal domain phosphatase SSU72 n=1 Tax=Sesamum radiatum TaxID=300843 RepID=A0AAW2VKN4_SESRA
MKLRYAMVCSSNQNRSMEAHALLKKEGFDVASYGTGQHVKLPGPSLREPNVYEFGTPYKHMLDDLRRKDPELSSISASRVAIPGIGEMAYYQCSRGMYL